MASCPAPYGRQGCLRYARGASLPPQAYRDEYPLAKRIRDDLLGVTAGIGIGLGLVALFFFFVVFIPMWARRYQMGLTPLSTTVASAAESVTDPVGGTPADGTAWQGNLPPIDWEITMTDEERHNLEAFRQDVRSMMEAPQFNLFAWPVLPYPVASVSNWDDRFDLFAKLTDAAYNEEPELSVYTDGQCASSVVAIAKYHLIDAEGSDPKENREEYAEVAKAADDLHAAIESMLAWPEFQTYVLQGRCTEDEMYVMLMYRALASRTTYSDDVDDTEHANDIYGALLEDESKCYGVSSAAQALLNRRGIPSFMASGSMFGDDDRRHAWIILWIGGRWKTLDITYAQSMEPADTVDVEAGTTGKAGYWGGCMKDYETYIEQNKMVVDQNCLDLMDAYEELIGAEHRSTAMEDLQRLRALTQSVSETIAGSDGQDADEA